MSEDYLSRVVSIFEEIFVRKNGPYPLHEPRFQGKESLYVEDCLTSTFVSSVGRYVEKFEHGLIAVTGVKHAIAVVNGTAALQVCLQVAGVRPNDEVLTPTLTFVATANAVTYNGAVNHFVDSCWSTLGMDPDKLDRYLAEIVTSQGGESFNRNTGRRIKAILPVHTFGHPVDLDGLLDVCEKYRLVLIEDAAESLGSLYKGEHTGSRGKLAAMSFNGNKIVTCGGGGAVLTNDDELAQQVRHLTTTAKVKHDWLFEHDEIGFNFRMPNLNAALGYGHLESLEVAVESKRALADAYMNAFRNVHGVEVFQEPAFAESNYWLNAILLTEDLVPQRDALLQHLNQKGILVRPAWNLMHHLAIYKDSPRMADLSVAERIAASLINIPSSPHLLTSLAF